MNDNPMSILLAEDESAHATAIHRAFENAGKKVQISVAGTLAEFRRIAQENPPDIAIMDLNLPDGRAVDALTWPPEAGPFPILLMTSYGNEHVAVEAIKAGALDYIVKSAEAFVEMPRTVERALREWNLLRERRHLEEQLRHSQKMEAIGQLAGGVAHDLNNILMVIYGYCSTLRMKVGNNFPFISDIDHIYSAAERAANLTRGLLAFSRKQIMAPKVVNLNEIVLNFGKLLTRIIGEDISFRTVSTGKPLIINADSGQIEQVLMNLATNARDAMPDGGVLTIETELQEIDEGLLLADGFGTPGRYAVISISDTGKGMDAETRKRIFEPFFTTKEVGKGTGLGLAIVYGVIKQHNGFITARSDPGMGTTFKIYLPQVYAEKICADEREDISECLLIGSETVLVAEDDSEIRELAEMVLTKFGYKVILAADGLDAIENFKDNMENVDILIMDMIMPKKSGREAYEEIRKLSPAARVLFISGYSPDLLHNRGFLDSGEEVIIKPIQPMELVKRVRSILDGPNMETASL
jgi:polar amino acid transport system substrate-binding protein